MSGNLTLKIKRNISNLIAFPITGRGKGETQMPPPRTPTAVLEARGSWRAKRRREKEPGLPPGIQRPPTWLSKDARRHWREHMPVLAEMRVMTEADRTVLAGLCEGLVLANAARDEMKRDGVVMESGKRHPAAFVWQQAWSVILRTCRELGLSPAARSGLTVEPVEEKHAEPEDPARFLRVG